MSAEDLLQRCAAIVRFPSSPDHVPEVITGGAGLRCPQSGAEFPYRDGVLDLLPKPGPLTLGQWALNTAPTAWLYDRVRDRILSLGGLPDFESEVASIQERQQLARGDVVIDLACGQGNFTVALARLVGPTGLVLGLDISRPMLARAARRVATGGLGTTLLIHGDAQRLPFTSDAVRNVNCSGGFHAFPDLPKALREIARISRPGTMLTAGMFAEDPGHPHPRLREWLRRRLGLHFVPLLWLGTQLEGLGYEDYRWSAPRRGFGYVSARKQHR